MINGPGKYSVNIATPGVTIRGTDGAPPVRCMMALAEQISELDSIVICGRVVGVRGLVMERAMPSGRYPRARQVMAIYADMEEHSARSLSCRDRPRGRRGYRLHKPLEAFLAQGKEEATSLAEGYRRLAEIVAASETER